MESIRVLLTCGNARVAIRDPVRCAWFQLVRFRESFGFQQNFVVDPGRCNVVDWAAHK